MDTATLGMSRDIAKRLAAFPVLAGVDPRSVRLIARAGHWFCLTGGEELPRVGMTDRALIFVLAGTMRVMVENAQGQLDPIALVGTGETLGEMSLLSDERSSARLYAHRDTELFALERKAFEHVAEDSPALVRNIARLLTDRLRRTTQRSFAPLAGRTVALLAAHDRIPLHKLAYQVIMALRAAGVRSVSHDATEAGRPAEWYQAIETAHDVVLHLAYPKDAVWGRQARRKADRVILVEDGEAAPGPAPDTSERVVLGDRLPARASAAAGLTHLVRPGSEKDVGRLARFLSHRAVGLVLSGGGARGFAHVGVVRALREAGVPIDAVGGTSMGAIIGAGVASEWGSDELVARMREAFVDNNPISDFTVPTISFFGGRRVHELLQRNFGELSIEELPRPFFCITSDLTHGTDAVHRSGPLVQRLRASVALPGLLPPLVIDGGIHVDGGVMNNLPVDHMAKLKPGLIAAVDVSGDTSLSPGADAALPGIVSILVRSGTVGNEFQRREARKQANVLFDPKVGHVAFRDWAAFDRAVELGHEHARAELEDRAGATLGLVRPETSGG